MWVNDKGPYCNGCFSLQIYYTRKKVKSNKSYNDLDFCIKCSGEDINIRFVLKDAHENKKNKEYLLLTCRTCGFNWEKDTYENFIRG